MEEYVWFCQRRQARDKARPGDAHEPTWQSPKVTSGSNATHSDPSRTRSHHFASRQPPSQPVHQSLSLQNTPDSVPLDLDEASEPVPHTWGCEPRTQHHVSEEGNSRDDDDDDGTGWDDPVERAVPRDDSYLYGGHREHAIESLNKFDEEEEEEEEEEETSSFFVHHAPPHTFHSHAPRHTTQHEEASSALSAHERARFAHLSSLAASYARRTPVNTRGPGHIQSSYTEPPPPPPPRPRPAQPLRDDSVPLSTSPPRRAIVPDAMAALEEENKRRRQHRCTSSAADALLDVDRLVRRGRGLYGPDTLFNGLASSRSSQLTLGTLNGNVPSAHAMHVYREGVRQVCGVDPASLHDAHLYRTRLTWPSARLEPATFASTDPPATTRTPRQTAEATDQSRSRPLNDGKWNQSTHLSTGESTTARADAVACGLHKASRSRGVARDGDLYDPRTGVALKATAIPARYFARWQTYTQTPHTFIERRRHPHHGKDRHHHHHHNLGDGSQDDAGPTARLARGEGVLDATARTPQRLAQAYHHGPAPRPTTRDRHNAHRDGNICEAETETCSSSSSSFSSPPSSTVPVSSGAASAEDDLSSRAYTVRDRRVTPQSQHEPVDGIRDGDQTHVASRYVQQDRSSRTSGFESALQEALGHDVSARPSVIVPSAWRLAASSSASSTSHASQLARRPKDGLVDSHNASGLTSVQLRQPLSQSSATEAVMSEGMSAEAARAHRRVFPVPPLLTPLLLEVEACLHAHELGSLLDIWRASRSAQDHVLQAVGFSRRSERETILWELERMTRNTSASCVMLAQP